MIMGKYNEFGYYEDFKYIPELTIEEIDALSEYKANSDSFCSILTGGCETEKNYNYAREFNEVNPFLLEGYQNPQAMVEKICNLYSAIYKMSKERTVKAKGETIVYRGTQTKEVKEFKETGKINKFLSTTLSKYTAVNRFALTWEKEGAALLKTAVSNKVPWIKYSSIAGINASNDRDISDLNEDEILIAPFCAVDINNEQNTRDEFGRNYKEYDVSINKEPLQELSAEEEEKGIQYLNDHSAECTQMMNAILSNQFANKQMDLEKKINNLRTSIYNLKKDDINGENSKFIDEDLEKIQQYEERIKELSNIENSAEKSVNKFKETIRTVCMSKCKAIEKEIDLDYKKKIEKFEERKNDKQVQNKLRQKEDIIKELMNLGINWDEKAKSYCLDAVLKDKKYLNQFASKLDIPYLEYLKDPNELDESNQQVMFRIDKMRGAIYEFIEQNVDDTSEQTFSEINELLQNINNDLPQYDTLYQNYNDKQNNAILSAIHQKILLYKSGVDFNNLEKQLNEIRGRSTLDKVKDFFKGKSKYKKEMAKQIPTALLKIARKKNELKKMPLHFEDINPQMIYDEVKQMKDTLGEDKTDEFNTMHNFILNHFEINEDVKAEQKQNNSELLPVVQKKHKKMSASEEMESFLKNNGYIQNNNNSNYMYNIKIDDVQQKAREMTENNKSIEKYLSMIENKLFVSSKMQREKEEPEKLAYNISYVNKGETEKLVGDNFDK